MHGGHSTEAPLNACRPQCRTFWAAQEAVKLIQFKILRVSNFRPISE